MNIILKRMGFILIFLLMEFILLGCIDLTCHPYYKGLWGLLGVRGELIAILIILILAVVFIIHGYFSIERKYKRKSYVAPKWPQNKELLKSLVGIIFIIIWSFFIASVLIPIFRFFNFTPPIKQILIAVVTLGSMFLVFFFLVKKCNIDMRW